MGTDTKVVTPNAGNNAVSCNHGMKMPSWFDIVNLNERLLEDSCDGLQASVERITKILDRELALVGGDGSRIILGGFSQGK